MSLLLTVRRNINGEELVSASDVGDTGWGSPNTRSLGGMGETSSAGIARDIQRELCTPIPVCEIYACLWAHSVFANTPRLHCAKRGAGVAAARCLESAEKPPEASAKGIVAGVGTLQLFAWGSGALLTAALPLHSSASVAAASRGPVCGCPRRTATKEDAEATALLQVSFVITAFCGVLWEIIRVYSVHDVCRWASGQDAWQW